MRSVAKLVVMLVVLGTLVGGGYYAYSSGLFLKGIGVYKAWRVTRRAGQLIPRCRESLSVAEKKVKQFRQRSQTILGEHPLTGSRDLRREHDRILADLRKCDQLPPSVISEALSRYRATIEKHIQRISSELSSEQEEAQRAVQRIIDETKQLSSQIEEAGTIKGDFYVALREIDDRLSDCERDMERAQRKYEFALRSEQENMNEAVRDYENLWQAQEAYLSGDYRKAGQLLEAVPEHSPARQQERPFWKAAAEAASEEKEQQKVGYVVGLWGHKIVVNMGVEAGIAPETTLAVELSQSPLVDPRNSDHVLGYEEMTIRVQTAHAKSSVCVPGGKTESRPRPGDRVRILKLRP